MPFLNFGSVGRKQVKTTSLERQSQPTQRKLNATEDFKLCNGKGKQKCSYKCYNAMFNQIERISISFRFLNQEEWSRDRH